MPRSWKLLVRLHPEEPDAGQGWALAETMGEALALADHPEAVAIPSQAMWPGAPGKRVFWSCKPPAVARRGAHQFGAGGSDRTLDRVMGKRDQGQAEVHTVV